MAQINFNGKELKDVGAGHILSELLRVVTRPPSLTTERTSAVAAALIKFAALGDLLENSDTNGISTSVGER